MTLKQFIRLILQEKIRDIEKITVITKNSNFHWNNDKMFVTLVIFPPNLGTMIRKIE